MADLNGTPEPPRYVVVGGGRPSAEELAALAVALTPVAVEDPDRDAAPSGWIRAALLEGVGERAFASPAELALRGF